MKPFAPSSHADWSHMNYARERSDRRWVEFEPSQPRQPLWKDIAAGLFLAVFVGVIVFFS